MQERKEELVELAEKINNFLEFNNVSLGEMNCICSLLGYNIALKNEGDKKCLLRKLREAKELTQAQLGKILNVNNQTISTWENNHKIPSNRNIKRLSAFFSVPVKELLNKSDVQTTKNITIIPDETEHGLAEIATEAFEFIKKHKVTHYEMSQIMSIIETLKKRSTLS